MLSYEKQFSRFSASFDGPKMDAVNNKTEMEISEHLNVLSSITVLLI